MYVFVALAQGSDSPSPNIKRSRKQMEEGGDLQQGVGEKIKPLPPTTSVVENFSPDVTAAKREHDGDGGGESSAAKKRRLTSDSLIVGELYTYTIHV